MSLKIDTARKFLEFVGHLHHRGHQQLRIVPYVRDGPAPIWACDLVPAAATRKEYDDVRRRVLEAVDQFNDTSVQRVREKHGDAIEIIRCTEYQRVAAPPTAQQCLWCGWDWHARRGHAAGSRANKRQTTKFQVY